MKIVIVSYLWFTIDNSPNIHVEIIWENVLYNKLTIKTLTYVKLNFYFVLVVGLHKTFAVIALQYFY